MDALAAYLAFLGGEYKCLLGTQRDVNRFSARGINVYRRELSGYCDLYQYIAVLRADAREECALFLETLFSGDVQSALSDIGMLPARGASGRTLNVFCTDAQRAEAAQAVREGANKKNPEKFFETI